MKKFVLAVIIAAAFAPLSAVAAPSLDAGKTIYETKCSTCHEILAGNRIGPDLAGVTERRDREWLRGFIQHPGDFFANGDPVAAELLAQYQIPMADLGLTDEDVESVLLYLESRDAA